MFYQFEIQKKATISKKEPIFCVFFRIWVCIEPKIQILVWIYYGCLESTKELLRLPLTTTTGRAERRKKGNPNSWGTLVRGLKTNLPSSSTVENLHSYSLKPVMILSNSRNVLTSRLLHNIGSYASISFKITNLGGLNCITPKFLHLELD